MRRGSCQLRCLWWRRRFCLLELLGKQQPNLRCKKRFFFDAGILNSSSSVSSFVRSLCVGVVNIIIIIKRCRLRPILIAKCFVVISCCCCCSFYSFAAPTERTNEGRSLQTGGRDMQILRQPSETLVTRQNETERTKTKYKEGERMFAHKAAATAAADNRCRLS